MVPRLMSLAIAAAAAACSNSGSKAKTTEPIPEMSSVSTCSGGRAFADAPFTVTEGTNPEIKGWQVGTSNIYKRKVTAADGLEPEQLTVQLARFESATQRELDSVILAAGDTLSLGDDDYCVTSITASLGDKRGTVTLRRLVP